MQPTFSPQWRKMLRAVTGATPTPQQSHTPKHKLRLETLEGREHPGTIAEGMLRAAFGGALLEPYQAMASVMGDAALRTARPASSAAPRFNTATPTTEHRPFSLPTLSATDTRPTNTTSAARQTATTTPFNVHNMAELDLGLSVEPERFAPPRLQPNKDGGSSGGGGGSHGKGAPPPNASPIAPPTGGSTANGGEPDQSFANPDTPTTKAALAKGGVPKQPKGLHGVGEHRHAEHFVTPPNDQPAAEMAAARRSGSRRP